MMIRGSLAAILTLCVLLTPTLSAQDKKKPGEDKKPDATKTKPTPQKKISYSQTVKGILKQFDRKSNRNFTLDIQTVDPKKLYDFNKWKSDTVRGILQEKNPIKRQQRTLQFRVDLVKRQAGIYTGRPVDLQAAEGIIVRSMFAPVVYDDKGNQVPWTKKALIELRKKDKLPGYPADYDILRKGQAIQVYIAKKTKSTEKKGIPGITEPIDPAVAPLPQVVLIVVLSQAQ